MIECEDCHSPEGNFDWAVAGYSDREAEKMMWAGYPPIEPVAFAEGPSTTPYWIMGAGVIVAAGVMMPLYRRRNRRDR